MTDRLDPWIQDILHRHLAGESADGDVERLIAEHPELTSREVRELRRFAALLRDPGVGTPLREPELVGAYVLQRELGRGGQAVVHLALDTRDRREVALKILDRRVSRRSVHDQAAARFRREARALRTLRHPGLCEILEDGEIDGRPYLAMRYVPGESLAQRIQRARCLDRSSAGLTESVAIHVVEQAARALHVAHEAGIVHRDVKPGNILIDDEGNPVIVDFGLAWNDGTDVTLTRTGQLPGSPAYMSPEQTQRGGLRVDRRSDVYSLGVTLYEALTLRRPFDAPTIEQLHSEICSCPFPDPRDRGVGLHPDLVRVLRTAMAREVELRYRTARDFADDLERVREGIPVRVHRVTPVTHLRLWARRHPGLATTLPVLGLLVATCIAVLAWALGNERDSNRRLRSAVLAARSSAALRDDPGRALRLAIEACDHERTFESTSALHAALDGLHELRTSLLDGTQIHVTWIDESSRRLALTTSSGFAVFDLRSWDLVFRRDGAHAGPDSIALSPGGDFVAWCADDGLLRISSLVLDDHSTAITVGHYERVSYASDGHVFALAPDRRLVELSPGGDTLLSEVEVPGFGALRFCRTGSPGGPVFLLGEESFVWKRGTSAVERLGSPRSSGPAHFGMSLDGDRTFLAGGPETGATLWDLESAQPLRRFDSPAAVVTGAASADGQLLALGSVDGCIRLYRRDADEPIAVIRGHSAAIHSLAFHPDGSRLITSSYDFSIRVTRLEDQRAVAILRGHRSVPMLTLVEDERLISVGPDMTVREWNLRSEGERHTHALTGAPLNVHLSTDGARALVCCGDAVRVIDEQRGREIARTPPNATGFHSATWLPGEHSFVTARGDGTTQEWDGDSGSLVRTLDAAASPAWFAAASPRGDLVAVALEDHTIRLVPTADGSLAVLRGHGGGVRHAVFDPTGARLVSSSEEEACVRVWDVESRREVASLSLPDVRPIHAVFSPGGDAVVVASWDGRARVWGWREEQVLATLSGHEAVVRCARFTPDGEQVLTGSHDGTVRIWNAHDGTPLARVPLGLGEVDWIAVGATGRRAVVATQAPAVRWIDVDPLPIARSRAAALSR